MRIRRGEILVADLNPPHGTEPGKRRPVVVVQTNLLNGVHPSTLVCPITSQVNRQAHTLRIHLRARDTGLDVDSDILADQVRAIDNRRLRNHVGTVPAAAMDELSRSLQILLDLDPT